MTGVLVYFAHPDVAYSHANRAMWDVARTVPGLTLVDLYAEYPRFDIDIPREQARLRAHDTIVIQCPVFWYSVPSLVKEWADLTLEKGFAYGAGAQALAGKSLLMAMTAAADEGAYATSGHQHYPIRTFLTPWEQTARLCGMKFLPPYMLYGAIDAADDGRSRRHAALYGKLLLALQMGRLKPMHWEDYEVVQAHNLASLLRGI